MSCRQDARPRRAAHADHGQDEPDPRCFELRQRDDAEGHAGQEEEAEGEIKPGQRALDEACPIDGYWTRTARSIPPDYDADSFFSIEHTGELPRFMVSPE